MADPHPIPFNKPALAGRESEYLLDAVDRMHISGDGYYTGRCHELLEEMLQAQRVLLTTSCTTALEMAALLLEIEPGDEVIMPSFTFVSTANAFALRGARIVFADIDPNTLNIDPDHVRSLVTERTRAIVPVHYAGVACDMDAIMAIARDHGVPVIEDAAQALGASYRDVPLGTIGSIGTLSFHETKNAICGEGGAIILNDEALVSRAEIIREKGTNRASFFRGEVDKYTWCDLGSSMLPSDLLAAFLYGQLENIEHLNSRRMMLWNRYQDAFKSLAERDDVDVPVIPEYASHNAHLFALRVADLEQRSNLISWLKARGIGSVFHYVPLHLSAMGQSMGGKEGQLPVTEREHERLLRLPLFPTLDVGDQDRVIAEVCAALGAKAGKPKVRVETFGVELDVRSVRPAQPEV
ncbi:MAG: dTDP-4-amino-4,6-dideoxygalactose transaminase [Planctomycetota bacterium]|nr:dTDP-4-amino-4,6-dideoxygalactose transaminase [Planctomycetota bacterium]